jgi:crotonobetainyl-CoA:carnitine CoA-transferase CaiB-like acyl-CoA transferase
MIRSCLRDIKVLDFSQIGAGPACSMILGDFGASVIKVEPPDGDIGRRLGPPWYGSQSPAFIAFNRNKRSICIDLKNADGNAVARRLALEADVLVESFRPGVMDKLGLGYASLSHERPRLIYCAISGYGQTGPLSRQAGVDGILQAASGLMGLVGDETSSPQKVQAPIVDVSTGYIGALAVLAALMERQNTGRGSYLDISLFATAVALQQSAVTSFLGDGRQPTKIGSAAPYSAPNEAFEASDGWIMVAAYIGERWKRLCDLLELPHLAEDPRFKTSSDRVTNRAAMREELRAAFYRRSCAEWLARLSDADILCSRVADYVDGQSSACSPQHGDQPGPSCYRLVSRTGFANKRLRVQPDPLHPTAAAGGARAVDPCRRGVHITRNRRSPFLRSNHGRLSEAIDRRLKLGAWSEGDDALNSPSRCAAASETKVGRVICRASVSSAVTVRSTSLFSGERRPLMLSHRTAQHREEYEEIITTAIATYAAFGRACRARPREKPLPWSDARG